jgi:hypothetical protein
LNKVGQQEASDTVQKKHIFLVARIQICLMGLTTKSMFFLGMLNRINLK